MSPMPPLRFSILVTSLCSLAAGVAGCAGQSSETERQLQRIQERVAILQNERDRFDERLIALEQQQDLWRAERGHAASATLSQRPALKVVRLEPEQSGAPAAENEPRAANPSAEPVSLPAAEGERVLISGTGDKLTTTKVAGGAE
jgi:hypothetical protein